MNLRLIVIYVGIIATYSLFCYTECKAVEKAQEVKKDADPPPPNKTEDAAPNDKGSDKKEKEKEKEKDDNKNNDDGDTRLEGRGFRASTVFFGIIFGMALMYGIMQLYAYWVKQNNDSTYRAY